MRSLVRQEVANFGAGEARHFKIEHHEVEAVIHGDLHGLPLHPQRFTDLESHPLERYAQ